MNAIGEQFRTARETRNLSLDQVSADTNIAKRYLTAMENEDFSVFPGDPYVIGFLRNYADYLGLDSQSMVQAFRGMRIQEQPVPIDALLSPPKTPWWPFAAGGGGILVLALILILVLPGRGRNPDDEGGDAPRQPTRYELSQPTLEKRLYVGDSVLVSYLNEQHLIVLKDIGDNVAIQSPVSTMRFMLGEEGSIDLDRDNAPELVAFIADFQKDAPDKGALIRFTAAASLGLGAEDVKPAVAAAEPATETQAAPERPSTQESVVFSGRRSPHPFVLNVTFRNYAMFRHEIDRKDRVESYYHKGDQISVTATNQAKIWSSNASAAKVNIQASGGQSMDVELGGPGEVVVKILRWSQGTDGLWTLALYDVN
ncbi:MAG TPA: helix-turn-helix domain-containing protein [Spirochaetales bacterium]|nr:helix-turn-helix domain-containing protein [Spirochaetales bacterium]